MSGIRRISVPAVPAGVDPALRRFLESLRSYLLARDGQTRVAQADDKTNLAKREMRDLLPGMVDLLVQHGTQEVIVKYIVDAENVFVQPAAPNFKGRTGIWVQTGLPGGGFTIWIEDGT